MIRRLVSRSCVKARLRANPPWAWIVRCLAAWIFRCAGVISAAYLMALLLSAYERDPDGFTEAFPLGLLEIGIIAFGAFGICELLGRLSSWTSPKCPLPRFRDRTQ